MQILGKLCECKDNDRPIIMQLLLLLVGAERIHKQHLLNEIQQLTEVVEDLVVDVPHVYDNFAFVLAALLRTKAIDYAWFQSEARRSIPNEDAFIR